MSKLPRRPGAFRGVEGLEGRRLLAGQLFPGETFDVGDRPYSVVSVDLNNDGRLDLATANFADQSSLSVLIGRGDGTFAPATPVALNGGGAVSIASGDFNKDGRADLVTANSIYDTVSVLLGQGDGTFAAPIDLSVGATDPLAVVVADFNGDGRADIATANDNNSTTAAGSVSVLLSNGDGTFAAPAKFTVGVSPTDLAVGDLNNDGKADLVTSNGVISSTVSVLLGQGNGTFAAAISTGVGTRPQSLALADFNADGKTDVATADDFNGVSVALGKGDGTLAVPTRFVIGLDPRSLLAGDFNGDGRVDLAAGSSDPYATTSSLGVVNVLLGNGNGGFSSGGRFSAATNTYGLASGDFDKDGLPDVAATGVNRGKLTVLLGSASSVFVTPRHVPLPEGYSYDMRSTDLNGDGQPDLVVADQNIVVLLGNPDGSFRTPVVYTPGTASETIAFADFNGDGKLDIATNTVPKTIGPPAGVVVLLGNGNGGFAIGATTSFGSTYSIAIADFNNDGRPDLAATSGFNNTVVILLGKGDGTFTNARSLPVGTNPISVIATDVTGDGRVDLIVANGGSANVSVLRGNGDGTFAARQNALAGVSNLTSVTTADFNRDGKTDVAVGSLGGNVGVLLGNGDGTFARGVPYFAGSDASDVTTGDFDGDHVLDLAVATNNDAAVVFLHNNGNGTFAAPRAFAVYTYPLSLTADDFNGDGKTDLVSGNGTSGTYNASVLLNQSPYEYVGIAGDTVTVFGTTAPIALGLSNGILSINTPAGVVPVQAAEVGQIVLSGTRVTFTGDLGGGAINGRIGLSVRANAAATFATSQHLATLTVNGTATLAPDGNRVLRVTGLSVAPTGRLDLADNAMVFDYKGAAQAASVAALIAKARSGGTWTGAGLTSSAAAANAAGTTTLGYLEATDYQSIYGTGGLFVGERLDTTAVLVRYTLYGDADLDRSVSIYDFNRLSSAFGATAATWFTGDFDYDSGVSINDFNLLGPNFGRMLATAPPAQGVAKGFAPAKR